MRLKLENKWIKKNKYSWERTEVQGRQRSQESGTQGKRRKKDEQRPWEEAAGLAAALRACLRKPPSPASSSSSPCKQLRAFNWFTISVNNRAIQERRKESGKEKGKILLPPGLTTTHAPLITFHSIGSMAEYLVFAHEYTDILIHTHTHKMNNHTCTVHKLLFK